MDADWIITAFVLIDTVLERFDHHSHTLTHLPDSEIIIVAVIAAKYFQNHHEHALCVMRALGYLSGHITISRFNRRLHPLNDWLAFLAVTLGQLFLRGDVFVIDSAPVPVLSPRPCPAVSQGPWTRVLRLLRCEKVFGWWLHMILYPSGVPVSFALMPGGFHDLTPVLELAYVLPPDARLFGDKAYNAADD